VAIIIRTLYNNQKWTAPCARPDSDPLCWRCMRQPSVKVDRPSPGVILCDGHCWEQSLCTFYEWGCTPQGRIWSPRAHIDDRVFFVYQLPPTGSRLSYAIWGCTHVVRIDRFMRQRNVDHWDAYAYSFLVVEPFTPIPLFSRPSNLSADELVGKPWGSGAYQFIDDDREERLLSLIPEEYRA